MSILIKGMEMPKSCSVCRLFGEYGCPFIGAVGYALTRDERNEDCPLVPVPPHGDLIDREYAIATACSGRIRTLPTTEDGEDWIRVEEVRESIKNSPTIIPAEEVYGQYTDTAGNFHWYGTHSGEHTIKAEEGER